MYNFLIKKILLLPYTINHFIQCNIEDNMHYALLSLFLCITPLSYGMELEKKIYTNEEKYALFKTNPDEAYKVISRNSEELTSLFKYGNQQQDPEFIQWLLVMKRPLYDEPCVQNTYQQSSNAGITLILQDYIDIEKNKREKIFNDFKKKAVLIQNYKDDQPQCTCTIS